MMWLFIISFWVKLELGELVLVEEREPENTNIEHFHKGREPNVKGTRIRRH